MVYTGEAQVPIWKNYDPEQLSKVETPQTDAGMHSTAFEPTPNYQWNNGDTSVREVQWPINKATNTFATTPSTTQEIHVGDTVEIQVASNSDAPIAAESNDVSCATVTVDQEEKTVTIIGVGQGTPTITISSMGSTNYTDASTTISVNVSRRDPTLTVDPDGSQSLAIGASKQISVTTDSDGAVSASSSAPGVATTSASGQTVTVSGASAGDAVITISVSQTAMYNAASVTLTTSVFKPTTANSSWEDIGKISDAGTAASFFAIGDTKPVTLNGTVGKLNLSDLTVDVFILGINHNEDKEGSNRIHWAVGKIDGKQIALCDSKYDKQVTDGTICFNMNHWGNYNFGGYKGCDARYDILGSTNKAPSGYGSAPESGRVGYDPTSYDIVNSPVPNTLAAAFPKTLRKVMKTVTKYTDNVAGHSDRVQSNVTASIDYLFYLAEYEVYGTSSQGNSYEADFQAQYDYFKAGNRCGLRKHNEQTTGAGAHLRSRSSGQLSFVSVQQTNGSGLKGYTNAGHAWGLFAGFAT